MVLIWWFVALGWLVVIAAGVVVLRRRMPRPALDADAVKVAHPERWKLLPRYRQLANRWLRWGLVQIVSLSLVVLGGVLLTSRLAAATNESPTEHNRDIVLCLDVSGSMRRVDVQLLTTFGQIVDQLKGERIGLTIFDASAVNVFPLTSDYEFVKTQLAEGANAMQSFGSDWTTGVREGVGSSLIGDGLAACLQRFDRSDSKRSRSVIFATDNQLAGDPIYTLTQATDLAIEPKVKVFAISPNSYGARWDELRRQALRTGGLAYELDSTTSADQVVRRIEATQAAQLRGAERLITHDTPLAGELLMLLGLLGYTVAGWRLSDRAGQAARRGQRR